MPTDPLPMRHAMLFELLRQQAVSDKTTARLQEVTCDLSTTDEARLQRRAFASLRPQTLQMAIRGIRHTNTRVPTQGPRWRPLPG